MLDIGLMQLPRNPRLRNLTLHSPKSNFLHEPKRPNSSLPVHNELARDLDDRHPRIIRRPIMNAIAQIPKPSFHARPVQFLHLGRIVARHCHFARDTNPVLVRRVLECQLHRLVVLEVFEFLAVFVGEEIEVRSLALGDGHAAGYGADAGAVGRHESYFEGVDGFVEFFDLFMFGSGGVELFGYCGVGFGVDFVFGYLFGHGDGVWGCCLIVV